MENGNLKTVLIFSMSKLIIINEVVLSIIINNRYVSNNYIKIKEF